MLPKTPPASWPLEGARKLAKEHGVDLAPHEPALTIWLNRLVEWNARLDLTAAKSLEELIDLMLTDAIVLAAKIPQASEGDAAKSLVDVGTGAGAPGMGVAILRPDLKVTLCEPLQKRTAFLRTVLGSGAPPSDRNNVTLSVMRGDALPKRAFDVVVSRATLPPPEWLALADTLMTPTGESWVLLAQGDEPSLPTLEAVDRTLYKWPHSGHERRAVRYRRLRQG